jgi:hypothetical protein
MLQDNGRDLQQVRIDTLRRGTRLEVQTQTRTYSIQNLSNGYVLISGHPRHCPRPIVAKVCGHPCDSGGRVISEGRRLKYFQPGCGFIHTSVVQSIRCADTKPSFLERLAEVPRRLLSCRSRSDS